MHVVVNYFYACMCMTIIAFFLHTLVQVIKHIYCPKSYKKDHGKKLSLHQTIKQTEQINSIPSFQTSIKLYMSMQLYIETQQSFSFVHVYRVRHLPTFVWLMVPYYFV